MAAAPELLLMTVAQYRQLPLREDVRQELHWGQIVTLTRPKMRHAKLQSRLVRLLRPYAEHLGVVESEVAFRALPEYDLRGADVAFVSSQRWDQTPDDDNLQGSPELVVEILSPSNTAAEMREKSALYLSTGARQFWVVDPKRKTVSVTEQSGITTVYQEQEMIPLRLFGGELALNDLFRLSPQSE
jgi:Uma2 family endonuclease